MGGRGERVILKSKKGVKNDRLEEIENDRRQKVNRRGKERRELKNEKIRR